MQSINVVLIKDQVVESLISFYPNEVKVAERTFKETCAQADSDNWKLLSEDEIENKLEDGYHLFNGGSVCISHSIG